MPVAEVVRAWVVENGCQGWVSMVIFVRLKLSHILCLKGPGIGRHIKFVKTSN